MNIKSLSGKVLLIFDAVILIFALLILNNFYFIRVSVQNIYYILYVIFCALTIFTLHKNYNLRLSHGVLIPIIILLLLTTIVNPIITLPLLLIYPLLKAKDSNMALKIISGVLYAFLIFMFITTFFLKTFFVSDKLLHNIPSPNKKYNITVTDNGQGALGGNTVAKLEKIYLNTFKKARTIYINPFGESPEIKWIDNETLEIDGTKIDVNSKVKIHVQN
ncbi:MAG: DUF5412 family protein [Clostridiaceae bacterium]